MSGKKYRVHPGPVISKTDGQRHYISAAQLMRLYGVRPDECEIAGSDHRRLRGHVDADSAMTDLYPRDSGNYSLPDRPQ